MTTHISQNSEEEGFCHILHPLKPAVPKLSLLINRYLIFKEFLQIQAVIVPPEQSEFSHPIEMCTYICVIYIQIHS